MSVSSDVVVLLDGSKTFWKTRTYLKIIIVQHMQAKCLEVISFDPAIGIEYPRIYLDTALIASKLDPDMIEETYALKKEALNRQKISKKKEDLVDEIKLNMIKQYAYSRVNLVTDLPDGKTEVNLSPSFDDILVEGDHGDNKIDVERLKPADLVPYEHKIVIVKSKVEEFNAMHEEMNKEVSLVNKELNKATRLASAALHAFFAAFRKHVRRLSISSNPRKRWILAINRILVQNYVRAVRIRLSRSTQYKDFSGLPDGIFQEISSATVVKSGNNAPKTLGGRKISGGLKGSFDDSLIIENFNRVFNDKNHYEQLQFAQNNITPFNNSGNTNSNTNSYENLRMQFNKSNTTGNVNYHMMSAQDTRDDVDANQVNANGFISRNIDFTNNINSRQYNYDCDEGSTDAASAQNTMTAGEEAAQKMLGPRRTSGGMLGSFDDSDLYFSRHHNINFNGEMFGTTDNTTTAATGEEQEETLPPITGVQSVHSLQTAIGLKMFRMNSSNNDFQKTQPIETRRVYGDNIKGATDTGLVDKSSINNNNINNNSSNNNISGNNSGNNSNENSTSIRNKGVKSPSRGRHNTAGFPDISPFGSPQATPRNSHNNSNSFHNHHVTFSTDNTPCGTPRLAPIGEQSSRNNNNSNNNSSNNSNDELSPQALALQFERNNERSARKAYNLQPIFNKNTAAWENRAGDVVNLSALARMEKEKHEEKGSVRRAPSRDEERSVRRIIPLHSHNSNSHIGNNHNSGTSSTENSFRRAPLSRENSTAGIGGSGNVSHDNHIHGLKLVKQVGSSRLSEAPKSMTNLHTAQSADKTIGSSSTTNLHSNSSNNSSPENSLRRGNKDGGGHLAQMRSLRKSNSNSTTHTTNSSSSFVNGLNSAINSAFNSQCNSQSNTAQNSAYNSAQNSAYNSLTTSQNNSCENLVGLLAQEVERNATLAAIA